SGRRGRCRFLGWTLLGSALRWRPQFAGALVRMIDPEETRSDEPERNAPCAVCGRALPTTRYVNVERWAIIVVCSEGCLRNARREGRRARWSARRLYARRAAVTAVLAAAFLAPHTGPAGRRR